MDKYGQVWTGLDSIDRFRQVLTGLDKYFMHIICIHIMYMLNCFFYLLDKAQGLQQLGIHHDTFNICHLAHFSNQ